MLGDKMEAYVDDMFVNSKKGVNHREDMDRVFTRMKMYNVYHNPSKFAFRVNSGKFLRFMVNQRGIEVNPENSMPLKKCGP